jgi:hypothetical protein
VFLCVGGFGQGRDSRSAASLIKLRALVGAPERGKGIRGRKVAQAHRIAPDLSRDGGGVCRSSASNSAASRQRS